MEIVTLTKTDLEKLIRDTVRVTVSQFSNKTAPPLMTKAQVADYLGKSTATIDRYMREGLPFRKEGKDHPEFLKSDVDRWLRERFQDVGFQTISGEADNREGQELV